MKKIIPLSLFLCLFILLAASFGTAQDAVLGLEDRAFTTHNLNQVGYFSTNIGQFYPYGGQFEKTLDDMGVKRIETVGQEFDPKLHEAVSMEEGEGSREVISEELQPGYVVGDEVIRHAMVKVKQEK